MPSEEPGPLVQALLIHSPPRAVSHTTLTSDARGDSSPTVPRANPLLSALHG